MPIYHKILRVSALLTAFLILFDSGLVFPITKQLSDNTLQYLASTNTGVFASVPQTELNSLSAELREREQELNDREREIAAREYDTDSKTDYSTYILSSILFILTTLIVLNYALDWRRERSVIYEKQTA